MSLLCYATARVHVYIPSYNHTHTPSLAQELTTHESQLQTAMDLQKHMIEAGEKLFRPKDILGDMDDSLCSLAQMVREVVDQCPQDSKRDLLANVFLSGGVTTMRGFQERFERELKKQVPHAVGYMRVFSDERSYAVWSGGSVLASVDAFEDSWEWRWEYQNEQRRNGEKGFDGDEE